VELCWQSSCFVPLHRAPAVASALQQTFVQAVHVTRNNSISMSANLVTREHKVVESTNLVKASQWDSHLATMKVTGSVFKVAKLTLECAIAEDINGDYSSLCVRMNMLLCPRHRLSVCSMSLAQTVLELYNTRKPNAEPKNSHRQYIHN